MVVYAQMKSAVSIMISERVPNHGDLEADDYEGNNSDTGKNATCYQHSVERF